MGWTVDWRTALPVLEDTSVHTTCSTQYWSTGWMCSCAVPCAVHSRKKSGFCGQRQHEGRPGLTRPPKRPLLSWKAICIEATHETLRLAARYDSCRFNPHTLRRRLPLAAKQVPAETARLRRLAQWPNTPVRQDESGCTGERLGSWEAGKLRRWRGHVRSM